jgi:hypothetical protein
MANVCLNGVGYADPAFLTVDDDTLYMAARSQGKVFPRDELSYVVTITTQTDPPPCTDAENSDASTDVPAAPAAKHDVRERSRDKDPGTGARGRNGRPNPGRGKVSTAPVTAVGREKA